MKHTNAWCRVAQTRSTPASHTQTVERWCDSLRRICIKLNPPISPCFVTWITFHLFHVSPYRWWQVHRVILVSCLWIDQSHFSWLMLLWAIWFIWFVIQHPFGGLLSWDPFLNVMCASGYIAFLLLWHVDHVARAVVDLWSSFIDKLWLQSVSQQIKGMTHMRF